MSVPECRIVSGRPRGRRPAARRSSSSGSKPFGTSWTRSAHPGWRARRSSDRLRRAGDDRGRAARTPRARAPAAAGRRRSNAGLPAHRSRSSTTSGGSPCAQPARAASSASHRRPGREDRVVVRRRRAAGARARAPRGSHAIDSGSASGRTPASANAGSALGRPRPSPRARRAASRRPRSSSANSTAPACSGAHTTSTSQPERREVAGERAPARRRTSLPGRSRGASRAAAASRRLYSHAFMRLIFDLRFAARRGDAAASGDALVTPRGSRGRGAPPTRARRPCSGAALGPRDGSALTLSPAAALAVGALLAALREGCGLRCGARGP